MTIALLEAAQAAVAVARVVGRATAEVEPAVAPTAMDVTVPAGTLDKYWEQTLSSGPVTVILKASSAVVTVALATA